MSDTREDKLYELLMQVKDIFAEEMVDIEFIKISQPLFIGSKRIKTIDGIELKEVISERDAEVW